ncbi:hypothetical protein Lepto7376_2261 [[Leptolyngbya] sp. PCC 7376]|uniref:hypothetical protein n=1 Tax=[Leptolyngbya] sp. PCC 7376 TaxID=111781 RepID=UPI00029EF49C|nr:hypothetical protein [[Leptolyngbya] sp. PCC 7376]AFY38551.1 hypothetical protein Lepto7376_2261 [[Leptolyngbya] sp. PCC 7376]
MKRFDKIVLGSIFVLSLLVALLWGFGDRQPISVQQFSWEGKQVSVADKFFSFSLNQAIDPDFVEANLSIDPLLPGRLSWTGKKFFYTLTDLPIYGQEYQLKLAAPEDSDSEQEEEEKTEEILPFTFEPFLTRFQSRDRAFAYIGTEGDDRGRLILFNLTKQEKSILTPADLTVLDFEAYPDGDRLLFAAIPNATFDANLEDLQLYTVTTGLEDDTVTTTDETVIGKIDLVLDSEEYVNGKFQLADNGQRIIVQRVNKEDSRDRSLWVIEGKAEPRGLGIPAEEFLLAPDADVVAVSQEGRLSIVPLGRNSGAIQAKEQFTRLLAFSPNHNEQIALQENDGITSLYLTNGDEDQDDQLLLRTLTPIVDCLYEPRYGETIYCLKIDQAESLGQIVEEPFLSALDIATGNETPLLALPNYRDVRLSVAADGLALLFDQVVTANPTQNSNLFTDSGLAVEGGRVWLLALPELEQDAEIQPVPPESLLPGFRPQWMP